MLYNNTDNELEKYLTYSYLKIFSVNNKNNVLNGILYDIYFDSGNRIRHEIFAPIPLIDSIWKLCNDYKDFTSSIQFIRDALSNYNQEFPYIPGKKESITVKIQVKEMYCTDENNWEIWYIDNIDYKDPFL